MGTNGIVFMKIDKTVIKETKYIAFFVAIFSVMMQAVFLVISKWDYTVLLGNIYGAALAVGNFFAMCLYIQKAVAQDEKEAKQTMKASQSIRFTMLVLFVGIGVVIPIFNWITIVAPLVFPSVACFLRPIIDKKK